jgi:hypothetical protein
MDKLCNKVTRDFDTTKPVQLVDSIAHGFLLTAVKKEADAGIRKADKSFKIVSMK